MNVASLLTMLVLALGLAVQPWSVLASVLLVSSERGLAKLVAFVVGWVVALLVVAAVTVAVYPASPSRASGSPAASWVEIVAGVLLAGWLLVRWRRPTPASTNDAQPRWMGRIDSMSPVLALALGAFLPNYVLVVAGVDEALSSGLTRGWLVVATLGFVVVASFGVAAPLGVLVVRRDDAPAVYERWRDWLVSHGRAVLFLVGAFLAVVLIVKGVVGLLT